MLRRFSVSIFAVCALLLSACGNTASSSAAQAPTPTSSDLPVIGNTAYPVPEVTVDVLFSDGATDLLNAFDTNQQDIKVQICADVAQVLSGLSDEELQLRANSMDDYSWSTLQDLVADCNSIAEGL
ncbi:MAG: hypothetical protein LKK46_06150 [Ancrocorticia sp.]|jgi:hypothetical protein|nr:hypothetical protein [Ancrocorticia sp.]